MRLEMTLDRYNDIKSVTEGSDHDIDLVRVISNGYVVVDVSPKTYSNLIYLGVLSCQRC